MLLGVDDNDNDDDKNRLDRGKLANSLKDSVYYHKQALQSKEFNIFHCWIQNGTEGSVRTHTRRPLNSEIRITIV